jgi:hypothetical protein
VKHVFRLRQSCTIAVLLGLAPATAVATGPSTSADPSLYPNYAELVRQNLALLQQDDYLDEEEEVEAPEKVRIDPEAFLELSADILTTSELGLSRPGEIQTRPRFGYKLGNARLFPRYRQTVRFDDNIFLTDTKAERRRAGVMDPDRDARKWDVRIEERPGLFMELPFGGGDHNLRAGYEANFVNFVRRHQGFGFIEQYAGAALNLKGNNLYLSAGDRYELRYDPIESQFAGVGVPGRPTNQLKRGINTAYYRVGLNAGKLNLEQGLTHENIDFKGPGTITRADRDELTFTVLAGLYTRDDLKLFFQYDYHTRRQFESFIGDTFFHRYSVGVSGKLGEDLETLTRVGWRHQLNEVNRAIGDQDSRDGGIDISSDTRLRLAEDTFLTLQAVRESQFSIIANFQIVQHGELAIEHLLYQNVLVRLGYFVDHVDPSLTGAPSFLTGGAGIGMKYIIEDWFDWDYAYRYRISRSPASDFSNNLVTAALNVKF